MLACVCVSAHPCVWEGHVVDQELQRKNLFLVDQLAGIMDNMYALPIDHQEKKQWPHFTPKLTNVALRNPGYRSWMSYPTKILVGEEHIKDALPIMTLPETYKAHFQPHPLRFTSTDLLRLTGSFYITHVDPYILDMVNKCHDKKLKARFVSLPPVCTRRHCSTLHTACKVNNSENGCTISWMSNGGIHKALGT